MGGYSVSIVRTFTGSKPIVPLLVREGGWSNRRPSAFRVSANRLGRAFGQVASSAAVRARRGPLPHAVLQDRRLAARVWGQVSGRCDLHDGAGDRWLGDGEPILAEPFEVELDG